MGVWSGAIAQGGERQGLPARPPPRAVYGPMLASSEPPNVCQRDLINGDRNKNVRKHKF